MIDANIWDYTDINRPGDLSYLSVACTTRCNLNCTYCSKKDRPVEDLDRDLLMGALEASVDLGLTKVEFTGGEALLYPYFWDMVQWLRKRDIVVLIVTNGTLIDRDTAKKLADSEVGVSISLSTLDAETFDRMSRKKGKLGTVFNALDLLKAEGYHPDKMPLLSIQSIASSETMDELPQLLAFARQQGGMFILNRAIPVGGMQAENVPSPAALKTFLDRESGGAGATVPFSGNSPCNRLTAGCYIGPDALVRPCPSIELTAGDLREESLKMIWRNSPILQQSKHIERFLEGSCGTCSEKDRCYGCRAVAHATWGNLTGPDPGCFRFSPDAIYNETHTKRN